MPSFRFVGALLLLGSLSGVARADFTKTIQVVPGVQVNAVTTWYYLNCDTSLGVGSYTVNVAPTNGTLAFGGLSGIVPGCPPGSPLLPAAVAYYTWTAGTSGPTSDYFQLYFMLNGQIAEVIDVTVELTITTSPSVSLVDPIPQLVSSGAVIGDNTSIGADLLATLGRVVTGIAADGASELLVRISGVSVGEQLTLNLLNDAGSLSSSANDDGALGLPGDSTFSANSVTVTAISTSQGPMGFAVYRAPIDFPRQGNTTDPGMSVRSVSIQVQPPTGTTATAVVTILRPPVILVHGLWSSATETWGKFSPLYNYGVSGDGRFFVAAVDYSNIVGYFGYIQLRASALGFGFNAPSVLQQMQGAIERFKTGDNPANIQAADVQADVVAHSMGGDITRTLPLASNAYTFYADKNYDSGNIHKLITIDTPHLGTPVARDLLNPENRCITATLDAFQKPVIASAGNVSGAVGDLSGDGHGGALSGALAALQTQGSAQLIPTAMIAAEENAANLNGLASCCGLAFVLQYWCPASDSPLTGYMNPLHWQDVFSDRFYHSAGDDALVPLASQLNGVTDVAPAQIFSGLVHSPGTEALGFNGPTVLDDPSDIVPNEVIGILNTPISNSSVFTLLTP